MPSKISQLNFADPDALRDLGESLRLRRKAIGINAMNAAQAAGISRVTLYRIEKGESSVTIGAWLNLASALGLSLGLNAGASSQSTAPGIIPTQIRIADYPQLQALAWQVHTDHLSPMEAYDVYERNQKHMNTQAMTEPEQQLWQALQTLAADIYRGKQANSVAESKHVQ